MSGPFDAVLIPGGGISETGELPPHVKARFELALTADTRFWIALSAATPHRPPRPRFEAHAGALYLASLGAEAGRILTETSSYDTIGNAWFARLLHTEPRGLRRLLVINSEFHIARTEAVFRWVFSAAPQPGYSLHFAASPNTGVTAAGVEERRRKEEAALAALREPAARIKTVEALHAWINSEHQAYAWPLLAQAFAPKSGRILETY
jgi:hypothetical protein